MQEATTPQPVGAAEGSLRAPLGQVLEVRGTELPDTYGNVTRQLASFRQETSDTKGTPPSLPKGQSLQ